MKTVILCIVMQFIAFHFSMARIPDISQVGCGEMQNPLSYLYPDHEFTLSAAFEFGSDEEPYPTIAGREVQNHAGTPPKTFSQPDTVAAALQRVMNLMREGKQEEPPKSASN